MGTNVYQVWRRFKDRIPVLKEFGIGWVNHINTQENVTAKAKQGVFVGSPLRAKACVKTLWLAGGFKEERVC